MAIKCTTADAVFTINAAHSVSLPNVDATSKITALWWVYLNNATPFIIWEYAGTDGSFIRIGHDGTNWQWSWRMGAGAVTTQTVTAITLNRWTYLAYWKEGNVHKVLHALEVQIPPASPGNWTAASVMVNVTAPIAFTLSLMTFRASQGNAVCNFKFSEVTQYIYSVQGNCSTWYYYWYSGNETYEWIAFLRRPGDLWNHTAYYPNLWSTVHDWTSYPDWTTLTFQNDPVVLNLAECNAFILPNVPIESIDMYISPGSVVGPIETSPSWSFPPPSDQYFMLENKGDVVQTNTKTTVLEMLYHGHDFFDGTGTYNHLDPHARAKDENGVILTSMYLIAPSSGAVVWPGGAAWPLNLTKLFQYQFGVSFSYPHTGFATVKTAHLVYPMFIIRYIGEFEPVIESGLYHIDPKKVTKHDSYYGDVEKKIPDPRVKTAIVGD